MCDRSAQEYFTDRAFTPSQCNKFPGQHPLWADCLYPSAQETILRSGGAVLSTRLTRTHVIIVNSSGKLPSRTCCTCHRSRSFWPEVKLYIPLTSHVLREVLVCNKAAQLVD